MADITVQNLTKYYGDRLILKDISFDIQPGEKVAILGATGALLSSVSSQQGESIPCISHAVVIKND